MTNMLRSTPWPQGRAVFISFSLVCAMSVPENSFGQQDTTRILFIGNSYVNSNDLPGMVQQLSTSMGEVVETMRVSPGGTTFEWHSTSAVTQAAIAQGGWDFVVLQEQSQRPSFPPALVAVDVYPYAASLVAQVHAVDPCTDVVFLMTWGRENGDQANCEFYEPLCTYEGMQQRLRDSYVEMAIDNTSWCAPVGVVWAQHREEHPTTGLYTDGSHPNVTGSYIAACTLASTMFRRSCAEATWSPSELTIDQASYIRSLSSAIVLDSMSTWNIGVSDPDVQFTWNMVGTGMVLFANNTTGSVEQTWDFGDGSTSDEVDPTHAYTTPGTYSVSLSVVDACGRTASRTEEINISTTGINEVQQHRPEVRLRSRSVSISGVPKHARITIMDNLGRFLLDTNVPASGLVELTNEQNGLLLWRITTTTGQHFDGKLYAQ
ncbi:MAG: PKD domain-containing protein [Flavobacteriales bacterium]|nr:PKD domain-containing protein [Flavobacteriales bacterium]